MQNKTSGKYEYHLSFLGNLFFHFPKFFFRFWILCLPLFDFVISQQSFQLMSRKNYQIGNVFETCFDLMSIFSWLTSKQTQVVLVLTVTVGSHLETFSAFLMMLLACLERWQLTLDSKFSVFRCKIMVFEWLEIGLSSVCFVDKKERLCTEQAK